MQDGRKRVVIENVLPQVDGGRFPIKRVTGESVTVTADIFCDGHDEISAVLHWRTSGDEDFREVPMRHLVNDRWTATFPIDEMTPHVYTCEGWVDAFKTWQVDLQKKFDAGQDVTMDLKEGVRFLVDAMERASGTGRDELELYVRRFGDLSMEQGVAAALDPALSELMARHPDRTLSTRFDRELPVWVDPPRALFSAWYEAFPRSLGTLASDADHGTLKDMEKLVPEIARMGFDVLYLPPIHPIGRTNRKGPNNITVAGPEDPGSPWAIGSSEGGHKSVHPRLGTMEDFLSLRKSAAESGLALALDIAFQCSPDHPYVAEHPEWFRHRVDGTIRYAENPPKKYQDIYPLNFETENWKELWEELLSVFLFWAGHGVRIFRVDNPHTKPLGFWEWVIAQVKERYPETIFLSEAFTRPKVMYHLAKAGFTQSYTYFTWRNTKPELTAYLNELTRTAPRDYFRPNFWPNTPDILPEYLQYGGRPAFMIRLILAATLSSNYGIYGPPFELFAGEGLPGREEYLHSEKFEIRKWEWDKPGNLKEFIARVNQIRRDNSALHTTWNLTFLNADNDFVLFYAKHTPEFDNIILTVVNLDPYHTQSAWLEVPIEQFGMGPGHSYLAHDLLGDDKFIWHGDRNFVELDPNVLPARIFRIRKRIKTETDFDYFM